MDQAGQRMTATECVAARRAANHAVWAVLLTPLNAALQAFLSVGLIPRKRRR